jgi:hypothetical protein
MIENRNTILAVILSGLVLIAWQYFYNVPQMERQRAQIALQNELAKPATQAESAATPQTGPASAPAVNQPASAAPAVSRDSAIAATPRIRIDTPRLSGSISLRGARIDDLSLVQFRETVNPASPAIVLFSPSGTAEPYYAEFGWVAASGSTVRIPDQNTLWQQEGSNSLSPDSPVTLKYDNGDGLVFRRTIAIDERYLFTVKDDVSNIGNAPVTLYPFALISRHGTPKVSGYYILHEGLISANRACRNTATRKSTTPRRSASRSPMAGSASPTNTGPRRCCRTPARSCRRGSRPISSAASTPIRPITCWTRRPSPSAAPAAPMRGCSPAPRKPASSASTFRSEVSAATTSSSISIISIF